MKEEDIEFKDENEFGEKKVTFKELVLRHIRKISDICCKEFTEGYWEKKPVQTSGGIMFMEVYHEDMRQAYCNAIDFLIDLIYPKSDKILKDYLKNFEGYKEQIKEEKDLLFNEEEDIEKKLKRKRVTFQQINLMFERVNFWSSSDEYVE